MIDWTQHRGGLGRLQGGFGRSTCVGLDRTRGGAFSRAWVWSSSTVRRVALNQIWCADKCWGFQLTWVWLRASLALHNSEVGSILGLGSTESSAWLGQIRAGTGRSVA